MKTWKASVAFVLAIGFLLPAMAFAQADARFVGVVLDPSGAVVPGATVVVKNERTGEERTVVSNTEGRYIVPNLRPSLYTIRATFGQLAPLQFDGLQLVAGQEFALDLTLQAAGVTETVTVQAQVSQIDLSSASVGVNVSEREVQGLPVNGRQMSQLMLQAPGSQNAGTGTWNDVRFSGRESNQNVVKFDGVEGSAIIDASPGNIGGQIASPFKLQASLENVQEFRVESNNYPAEHGTGTGGQVNVVTKSGSNLFHGAMFEYFRDDALDAPNYFDSTRNPDGSVIEELPKSKLSQHQFGGIVRRPADERQGVLLRQLRRVPARCRRELRRGRAKQCGVGTGRSGDCRSASRASWRRARCSCQARQRTRTSTSTSFRGSRTSRRMPSASVSTTGPARTGTPTSACSATMAASFGRKGSAAAWWKSPTPR